MTDLLSSDDFTIRQKVVNLMPALLAVGIVQLLLLAGAPQEAPHVDKLLDNAADYSWVGAVFLLATSGLLAFLLEPLEMATIRFLEGYWNSFGWLARIAEIGTWVQRRRRSRFRWIHDEIGIEPHLTVARRQLKSMPRRWTLLPTSLGNALRAMEERAGQPYGLNSLAAWPRLYEALPEATIKRTTEARNALDTATRLCLSLTLSGIVSFGLLARHGWWLLAPAAMFLLAAVAYRASIAAANNYGTVVAAAFDVHRLRLLQQMRIEVPASLVQEQKLNRILTRVWRRESLLPGTDVTYGRTDSDIGLHHQASRPGENNS